VARTTRSLDPVLAPGATDKEAPETEVETASPFELPSTLYVKFDVGT
jgi:hypothetical protein